MVSVRQTRVLPHMHQLFWNAYKSMVSYLPNYSVFYKTLQNNTYKGQINPKQMPWKQLYKLIVLRLVRIGFCIQLFSDSTSWWTPLLLAVHFPLPWGVTDFHQLDCTYTGSSKKQYAKKLHLILLLIYPCCWRFFYIIIFVITVISSATH